MVAAPSSNDVTKLCASDGARLGIYPVGDAPSGIASTVANIWVTNSRKNESATYSVTKLRASDGLELGT